MTIYISKAGLLELNREHEERIKITRKDIAEAISSAKELGDLSENFEYQDAKEQQSLNESRILQLEDLIHDSVIVEETSGNDRIGLGCTFCAIVNGKEKTFTMVGSTEADPLSGKISNESPLGRTLYGHRKGETVSVETPNGAIEYQIITIS